MKKLLTLLFLSAALFVKAQVKDSTIVYINGIQNNKPVQLAAAPYIYSKDTIATANTVTFTDTVKASGWYEICPLMNLIKGTTSLQWLMSYVNENGAIIAYSPSFITNGDSSYGSVCKWLPAGAILTFHGYVRSGTAVYHWGVRIRRLP